MKKNIAIGICIFLIFTLALSFNNGWKILVAQSPMPPDQKKSREIAEEYLLNSLTFRFDGIEDSLKLVDTNTLKCPYCWEFVFEFQCRHAGYGNRTGMMLAQVITPHTARIIVEYGRVTSAIMDKKWDMMAQKMIANLSYKPSGVSIAYHEKALIAGTIAIIALILIVGVIVFILVLKIKKRRRRR